MLTNKGDHFPEPIETSHPSHRSDCRECHSQEERDTVQLNGLHVRTVSEHQTKGVRSYPVLKSVEPFHERKHRPQYG